MIFFVIFKAFDIYEIIVFRAISLTLFIIMIFFILTIFKLFLRLISYFIIRNCFKINAIIKMSI